MRRFLCWLLGVPPVVQIDYLHGMAERIADLEDGAAHIDRRFVRLQQQVTRWARTVDDDLEDDDLEEDEVLREIRRAQHG